MSSHYGHMARTHTLWGIWEPATPTEGEGTFYRGLPPAHYDEQTRDCPATLADRVDTDRAAAVWEAALAAEWRGTPVWFHGDVAHGNLLVVNGKLSAVIDFGTSGIGDPACDLVLARTMLHDNSRKAFREAVDQPEDTIVANRMATG
jgi:aminoglycoside phosphotransferase (APT) family kinase protein